MESIITLLGSEAGSLLLLDEENQELYFDAALGEKGRKLKGMKLRVGQGASGWVAQHSVPLIINDVKNDPRVFNRADEISGFETRNILSVPVMLDEKVVGVLQALNKHNNLPFDDKDVRLFTALSNQVAVALENSSLNQEVKEIFLSTVETLSDAIEKRDPYTGGHVRRVVEYSMKIGERLGLSDHEKEQLWLCAALHDLGKIGVDDAILRKPGRLDDEELTKMKSHSEIGEKLIRNIPKLQEISRAIREHHERYDGQGYPDGLNADNITLNARIISVAGTFDAMTSDRPYRKELSDEERVRNILNEKNIQFDGIVVEAFMDVSGREILTNGQA